MPPWRAGLGEHRTLLTNAGSLVATWIVTSALGALFWVVAARAFPQDSVGLASAAVAAMTLLGTLATLGLNTLAMAEVARNPANARAVISSSLLATLASGLVLGLVFAACAPLISDELDPIGGTVPAILVFGIGVGVTAAAYVLDQALIGLFRGGTQLWRNVVFAALKLIVLLLFGLWFSDQLGMGIFTTWVVGLVLSLAVIAPSAIRRAKGLAAFRPRMNALRGESGGAVDHHVFNLALKAPAMALPVIVAAMLSTHVNAAFYVASMIAGFVWVVPGSLGTVLYASGASRSEGLANRVRLSMRISFATSVAAIVVLCVAASPILHLFGPGYAEEAAWSLRILALASLPLVIKVHFATIKRVGGNFRAVIPLVLCGTALELAFAIAGASIGGINGLSIGWALALCVEAAVMAPAVMRMLGRPMRAGRGEPAPRPPQQPWWEGETS